jgi:hypothetical protein
MIDYFDRYKLPSWAMFEMGTAPVYWKTMNGLPPTSVSFSSYFQVLRLFNSINFLQNFFGLG